MMKRVVLIAGLVVCGGITSAVAQVCAGAAKGENVTITATGEAKGRPDTMYVTLAAEAIAGNATDAFQQCKQKSDAAAKAIVDLKVPNSEVVREMYEFSSPAAGNPYGMAQPSAVPAGTKVSQVLKVKVALNKKVAMDKLAEIVARVLDAANKTGVGFKQRSQWPVQVTGQTTVTPVTYVLKDATALKKRAVADSLSKASEIKETLARSGVKAGKLIGVAYAQTLQGQWPAFWQAASANAQQPDAKSAVSSSPEEITVRCSITYTYEVERFKE